MSQRVISLLIPSLAIGGSERQAVTLARGLAAAGREVSIMTFHPGEASLEAALAAEGVSRLLLPRGNPFAAVSAATRHCIERHVGVAAAFLVSTQAFALAVKAGNPEMRLIAAVRDTLPVYYHRNVAPLLYDAAVFGWGKGIDAFVFNSAQGARAKRIEPSDPRVSVIPNGIDGIRFAPDSGARNRFRESMAIRSDETLVGMAANLTTYKGFPTLIEAAVILRKRGELFRFIVLGSDEGSFGQQLRSQAEAVVPGGFIFMGRTAHVEKTLPAFDFGCSASYTEGFSNSLAEIMACGVPCIATSVGESAEIVGETGWIVPPRDADALAGALVAARSTPFAERRARGEAARIRISTRYSSERMIGAYGDLCDRLVARA